jgi:hypothetical protein
MTTQIPGTPWIDVFCPGCGRRAKSPAGLARERIQASGGELCPTAGAPGQRRSRVNRTRGTSRAIDLQKVDRHPLALAPRPAIASSLGVFAEFETIPARERQLGAIRRPRPPRRVAFTFLRIAFRPIDRIEAVGI